MLFSTNEVDRKDDHGQLSKLLVTEEHLFMIRFESGATNVLGNSSVSKASTMNK